MSIKILLADDSLTIQKVVELTFSDAETRLMAVGSGDAAVRALDDFQPDIVLADVVMPGLTGYDVCEAVKQRPGGAFVPVVLLTGTFEPFDRARADRVGSDAIVTKPFDSHALQSLVRELVAKGNAARAEAAAAPPPAPEPPPPAFTLSDLDAPPEPAAPVDTGSTLVLTPLDLDESAPPPFVEAATAAPAGESIYATMAMKIPTPEELSAAAPAPFELAEEPPASETSSPFDAEESHSEPVSEAFASEQPFVVDEEPEAAPPVEADAPAVEEVPWSEEPAPVAALSAEPVLSVEPPPPPAFDPLSAWAPPPPPPPPPFEAVEAFVPPPPPPPPAFYEPEPPAPPPPPRFFEPEPVATAQVGGDGPDTAPVVPLAPAALQETEPFAVAAAADEESPAETAPEAPFEPAPEPAPAVAAEGPMEIEVEVEGEPVPAESLVEPPAADEISVEDDASAVGPSEAVEPFPEMDAAAHVAEEAPWDEGPAPTVPPPPPLDAGPEELSDGAEPITRDLEADMQAFEASGRVRRRPEIWERHAALIGEEVPGDIDVPGVAPETPAAAPKESGSTDLEEIAAAARLEDLSALIPAGAASAAPAEPAVVPEPAAAVTTAPISPAPAAGLSDADVDRIARRVVELLSDKAVRDIAWEVVPEYAERLVRERIAEVERAG